MSSEDEKWCEVSLRISGDPLDFALLTSIAGVEPTCVCRKGEHHNGNPRYAKHREDVWIWRITSDTAEPFEQQLRRAVEHLRGSGQEIKSVAVRSHGEAYFFLGFSSGSGQGGANLPADLLLSLGELGLDIALDLYPPDSPDV